MSGYVYASPTLRVELSSDPTYPQFRKLLDSTVEWLRTADPKLECVAERLEAEGLEATLSSQGPSGDAPRQGNFRPLYEVTRLYGQRLAGQSTDATLWNKSDITHWYCDSVARGLTRDQVLRDRLRAFVEVLAHMRNVLSVPGPPARRDFGWIVKEVVERTEGAKLTPDRLRAGIRAAGSEVKALLELAHGMGAVEHTGPSGYAVVEVPEASVIEARLFGLKTSIRGFDALTGGGLGLRSPGRVEGRPAGGAGDGIVGVVRGRFGAGKSTLAVQLAFEMARKGGVGVLMLLEQSPAEVSSQASHFGWQPTPGRKEFKLLEDTGPDGGEKLDEFGEELQERAKRGGHQPGLLYIHSPADSTLANFEDSLVDLAETLVPEPRGQAGAHEDERPLLSFIVVDPLDAVLLSSDDLAGGKPVLVRNRTEQILRYVSRKGITLWLTTTDLEARSAGGGDEGYGFLPNMGDAVIRMTTLEAGERRSRRMVREPPLRLLEFEKVRTQPFVKGVHPMEIHSGEGIRIHPSGAAGRDLRTWFPAAQSTQGSLSLGHAFIDFALGAGGIHPGSMTTLMGPTGCAKTELGLLYLLQDAEEHRPDEFCLFVSFRDSEESLQTILRGSVGRQVAPIREDLPWWPDWLHLLTIEVGEASSGKVLDQLREKFRGLPPGQRYTRVVIDNVAYMDLTTPLVRDDDLFIPNLLELLEREQVTPLFITSLIEERRDESTIQTQIRDASHNLLMLKRHQRGHIELQVKKSQGLLHMPQPLEVSIEDSAHDLGSARDLGRALLALMTGVPEEADQALQRLTRPSPSGHWNALGIHRAVNTLLHGAVQELEHAEERARQAGQGEQKENLARLRRRIERWMAGRQVLPRTSRTDRDVPVSLGFAEAISKTVVPFLFWAQTSPSGRSEYGLDLKRRHFARAVLSEFAYRVFSEICTQQQWPLWPEPGLQPMLLDPELVQRALVSRVPLQWAGAACLVPSAVTKVLDSLADGLGSPPGTPRIPRPAHITSWWTLYQRIVDRLELRQGITIRLHNLDRFGWGVDEDLERSGVARRSARDPWRSV